MQQKLHISKYQQKCGGGGALLKVVPKQTTVLIIFSYPCNGSESIVFGSNFRNGDFDGLTRYEDP